MIFAWFGGVIWFATSTCVATYVVRPWIFRRAILHRFWVAVDQPPRRRTTSVMSFPRFVRREHRRATSEQLADVLDAAGRELRLGSSLHGSLLVALQRHDIGADVEWLIHAARTGAALDEAISAHIALRGTTRQTETDDERHRQFALRSIIAASQGADAVHALESAARTLRAAAAVAADARAAVTYTRTSVNVLTVVPLLLVVWLLVRDADVRRFFVTLPGLVCLVGGISLNALGRWIVYRIAARAMRIDSEVSDFIDLISVHVRSSSPPAAAFTAASVHVEGRLGVTARQVVAAMNDGSRFVEALAEHRAAFGVNAHALLDALIDTERDGLPPRELFERLSRDASAERRRSSERRIRALPVRLSLPLVGCILPAYVLLAVVPLLAGQISSVVIDPR